MNTTSKKRNWYLTVASALLSAIFVWFAANAWFIEYESKVPFEPVVRTLTSIIFAAIAVLLARVALRGYSKTSLKTLLRDLLSGGL